MPSLIPSCLMLAIVLLCKHHFYLAFTCFLLGGVDGVYYTLLPVEIVGRRYE